MKRREEFAACIAILSIALAASAQDQSPPKIDHIVGDLKKSIAFYHDLLGLEIKSQSKDFAMLQSGNVGVFLSITHWDWEQKRPTNARRGGGCIRTSKLPTSQQSSNKRAKPVTELRRNRENTVGARKRLSLI